MFNSKFQARLAPKEWLFAAICQHSSSNSWDMLAAFRLPVWKRWIPFGCCNFDRILIPWHSSFCFQKSIRCSSPCFFQILECESQMEMYFSFKLFFLCYKVYILPVPFDPNESGSSPEMCGSRFQNAKKLIRLRYVSSICSSVVVQ
jgi:hypothetical protein